MPLLLQTNEESVAGALKQEEEAKRVQEQRLALEPEALRAQREEAKRLKDLHFEAVRLKARAGLVQLLEDAKLSHHLPAFEQDGAVCANDVIEMSEEGHIRVQMS